MTTEASASKNPLQREGTSQKQRFPIALDTDYAKLDDRDLYDFLDFIYKYSENICYIPNDGISIGKKDKNLHWQPFFSYGIILLSHISKNASIESNRVFKADLYDLLPQNLETELDKIEIKFTEYFDKIKQWHLKFPAEDSFKPLLEKIIEDIENSVAKDLRHFKLVIQVQKNELNFISMYTVKSFDILMD